MKYNPVINTVYSISAWMKQEFIRFLTNSLMLPVFLSSLIHDNRRDHNTRQYHISFSVPHWWKVRKWLKPHQTVCLVKDKNWSMLSFLSEEQWWMFFANWTSKPQVCLRDPAFNHASGLPTANEKQAASAERKSRSAAPACECIHCSWWESRYNVYRRRRVPEPLAETRVGTVVWLTSKTNPYRRVQRVLQEIRQRGERIFLALRKKARAAQTGTRDVGDTVVVSTTVGTIKSHRVHISSTQRRSSSAVAQTASNAQSSHCVQTHVNQASRRGLDLSKDTKQYYHALYRIS